MSSITAGASLFWMAFFAATVAAAPSACTNVDPNVEVCVDPGNNEITSLNFSEVTSETSTYTALGGNIVGDHQARFGLTEPGSSPPLFSDIVNVTSNAANNTIEFDFFSDENERLINRGLPIVTMAPEDGSRQTAFFIDNNTGVPLNLPFIVTLQSDVGENEPEPIPEPGSLLLLVSGLVPLWFLFQRRRTA
jgi:hypothetical protein